MYGNELLIDGALGQANDMTIRSRAGQHDNPSEILCDGRPVTWATEGESLVFHETIQPGQQKLFRAIYSDNAQTQKVRRPLRFELSVAARRILCEVRDEYVSKSRFLSDTAARLRSVRRKSV
jgi:hypothetical protein